VECLTLKKTNRIVYFSTFVSKIAAWNLDFDPGGAPNPQGPGSGTLARYFWFPDYR
jgi:hypothetical protein